MNNISAVLVVKENPPHVLETLRSLEDFASEIIVADIGISENLKKQLDKNKKVKIVDIKQDVPYIELIREDLKKYVKNDYIIYLDPDEVLPLSLKKTLLANFKSYDYFKIPRKNLILDHWMQYTRWWPDYQVRFYKKGAVVWPRKLHAPAQTRGQGLTLEPNEANAIVHYNYESVDEYVSKAMRYAKSEAKENLLNNTDLTLRETVHQALSEFISRYFAHEGYKDGLHGLLLSFMQMMYRFLVYMYYWEGKKYKNDGDEKTQIQETKRYFLQGLTETNYWLVKKNLSLSIQKLKNKVQNILLKITS